MRVMYELICRSWKLNGVVDFILEGFIGIKYYGYTVYVVIYAKQCAIYFKDIEFKSLLWMN